MPKAKLPLGATKEEYERYEELRLAVGEKNDCVPRAVAAATGTDYKVVLQLFAEAGRKSRRGTPITLMEEVLSKLGFKITKLDTSDFNPPSRAARGKHGITSHHPDRFPQMWRDTGMLICYNRTHAWAVVNGVNVDWSRGRSLPVNRIVKVEKVS